MPSTRVRVRVPLWGSRISQRPTTKVRSAQASRGEEAADAVGGEGRRGEDGADDDEDDADEDRGAEAKISGRRIATTPMQIATIPSVRRGFQVLGEARRAPRGRVMLLRTPWTRTLSSADAATRGTDSLFRDQNLACWPITPPRSRSR